MTSRCACALLCALLLLSLYDPISARRSGFSSRGGSHSYPKSGGLSGHSSSSHGSHSYPSSHGGGLSGGGGGSHSYPSSHGGLSGSGSSGSSGSHSYPSSNTGLSGGGSHPYPSSGSSGHSYPSSGSSGHGYPSSNNHHSGSHGYPASNSLSGNTHSTTNVHHHYHYNPPQQIRVVSPSGVPVHYNTYRGTPPTYVYQYKDSGSKYGTLLAGLALLNLGALTAVAVTNHNSNHGSSYTPKPGEVCIFGIKKANGDYEETKIKCDMITSFIWAEEAKHTNGPQNTTVVTTTVTNTTIVNTTNDMPMPQTNYTMLPNGTLVPNNETLVNSTVPLNDTSISTVITTTVTNTTHVADALDVKGPPVQVTPGMSCYVIRTTPTNRLKKEVSCAALQAYADQSLKRNAANRLSPAFTLALAAVFTYIIN